MKHSLRLFVCVLVRGLPLLAAAQSYPAKPIRWIVPYPPGGAFDAITRVVAVPLAAGLGQQVVIDNRVGAAGIIGTDTGAKASPDGYTLVSGDNGTLVYNSVLYKKLPYDPARDLQAVGMYGRVPLFIAAGESTGIRSLRQLIDLAKERPGKITYASSGTGSPQHLSMELLQRRAGIQLIHIPYKGFGLAAQDILAGRVDLSVQTLGTLKTHVAAGKVRALASTDEKRIASLPDVPTVAETGLPEYSAMVWYVMLAPIATPREIVGRLNQELRRALVTPEVMSKLTDIGAESALVSPDEAAEILRKERAIWGPLISGLGIALD